MIFIASDQAFLEFLERIYTNAAHVHYLEIDGKEMEPESFINGIQGRA